MSSNLKNSLPLPKHVAIIMDGNGRWAKKKLLPRSVGHKKGADNFRIITKYANQIGISYLTVFAFSTENWKRPKNEVDFLMRLFEKYLKEALRDFKLENIKVCFLGNLDTIPKNVKELILKIQKFTENKTSMTLNIAINYGSKSEILNAAFSLAKISNKINFDIFDEDDFSKLLYTKDQPDVDLVIRTGGEKRTSNFLLWQSAYAEYIFSNILWPDFKTKDFDKALNEFKLRIRRFGRVTD
ncbi:MAG: di-trans,poly-cis-decaprenylcistransferase [Oscillospiraceae bacterium]|jgi:undecaprenyl diphosphate synthase|nr:di-trans,poly-cis-decaprenylcistransferase [Oscillospiraceae bacterium]